MASKWDEIKCNYMNDFFRCVNARKKGIDKEETIAYIDDLTGRVVYADPSARSDDYAQEVIQNVLSELKSPLRITKTGEYIDITVPTMLGNMTVTLEPDGMTGNGNDKAFIGFETSGHAEKYYDLECAGVDQTGIHLYTWDHGTQDTHRSTIPKSEIDECCAVLSAREG